MTCGNLAWPHTHTLNQGNEWIINPVKKTIDQQSGGFNTLVSILDKKKWLKDLGFDNKNNGIMIL